MAFCSNCGQGIVNGAFFCSRCGAPVGLNNSSRQTVFEGNIHKCPNCGQAINSLNTKCPSCGFEFRDNVPSNSVRMFSQRIQEIERSRPIPYRKKNWWEIDKTDNEVITLIRNFPVPNNVGDMFEFMSLAMSNINYSALVEDGVPSQAEKVKSEAWINKMSQIYAKARMIDISEADYSKLSQMYSSVFDMKERAKKDASKANRRTWIGAIIGLSAIIGFVTAVAVSFIVGSKHKISEYKTKIEQSISESEYQDALMYVELLMRESDDEAKVDARSYLQSLLEQSYKDNIKIEYSTFPQEEIDPELSSSKTKKAVEEYIKTTIDDFYKENPIRNAK